MGTITKEHILYLINEQISTMQLDELPRLKSGTEHPVWSNPIGIPPVTFKEEDFLTQEELNEYLAQKANDDGVRSYEMTTLIGTPQGKLISLNPEVKTSSGRIRDTKYNSVYEDEIIEGVAVCYRLRESKIRPGISVYLYDGYGYWPPKVDINREKIFQKKDMFIVVSDDTPNRPLALLADLRRNKFLESQYQASSEPLLAAETYVKRNLHFKNINELFSREDIKRHLYKCALPPIMANVKFAQPITDKRNEEKYLPPNYDFLLSGIWPATDIQAALSSIIDYKAAVEAGEDPPLMPEPTRMPRNPRYPKVYARGNWLFSNKIAGAENSKQTKKLRLWMRAIQGGELSFYIGTDLHILGSAGENNMRMTATFSVASEIREASKDWASYKIDPINPITVETIMPIPPDIKLYNLTDEDLAIQRGGKSSPEFIFLTNVYQDLLGKLGERILQINPDESLEKFLMFEPEDVETAIQEERKPKIIITEAQLKKLLDIIK